MKILEVIHDFLPRHQAGSELYCYHISKELQRLGNEICLFYTEIDHTRPEYSLRKGEYDGISFWEVVNNHAYKTFEETYSNKKIEDVFLSLLNEFQPDAVQFHHLLSLSYGCVRLCKERSIPVIFTLHDYWLTCPRGGQRYKGNGLVCDVIRFQNCSECISRYSVPSNSIAKVVKKIIAYFERSDSPNLISALIHGRAQVPLSSFFSQGNLIIDGDSKETLFAHPPCRVEITRQIPVDAELIFSIAMPPTTYDQPGEGVLFTIQCDGETIYKRHLHPKINKEDQGWKSEYVSLKAWAGKRKLVFETKAFPGEAYDFCSAGWGDPKIITLQQESFEPSLMSSARTFGEKFLSYFQKNRLQKMMEFRTRKTKELFEQVDLFIAPSPFLRETFIQYGLSPAKIIYSDYGIASRNFYSRVRILKKPIRFSYIGTFVEHKGVHVLIEAFNQLPSDEALLDLYGDLSEFSGYVKRIQNMIAHPGITLRGRAENRDIPQILEQTDALIVPSIWYENSPITIHEAFLAGVPVITSKFGGMADLVKHEKNGLLFEVGNSTDLYHCLKRCVEEPSLLDSIRPEPTSVKTITDDALWTASVLDALSNHTGIPAPIK